MNTYVDLSSSLSQSRAVVGGSVMGSMTPTMTGIKIGRSFWSHFLLGLRLVRAVRQIQTELDELLIKDDRYLVDMGISRDEIKRAQQASFSEVLHYISERPDLMA